jgi:protein-S-isoprenylcysteine O-methyltransferase
MNTVAILLFSLLLTVANVAHAANMVLTGLDGDVTTNEYKSFIDKINSLPPPPTNNIGNTMVYESAGGAKLHGMQTFYSFTKDRRVLDLAITWSDAFLHARNDPVTGRTVWTGKRELCWPNKETNNLYALYTGTENGDVIEHIVNTAKLILENPSLWSQEAPPDTCGFGRTYLDRAKTYVNECQRSAETTIVPWYVRSTREGYHLIHPVSRAYWNASVSEGPVPWNQQQFIVGGLLRLAQCHRLLNDGNTNIAYYEKITGHAADWFFSTAMLVSAQGRICYDWSYVVTWDPATQPEDTGHSYYDVYVMRAYLANLGPSRTNMQRLINTARFAMHLGTNRFSGSINGTSSQDRYERKYLNYGWIEMSVLDREFYKLLAGAVLTSHQYYDDVSVQAAVLSVKHYWATTSSAPETQVVLDDTKGIPPMPQISQFSLRRLNRQPPVAIAAMLLGISELLLTLLKRSKSNATSKDRNSLKLIWLVNLTTIAVGIFASYRLREYRLSWPNIGLEIGTCLFVAGLVLRWYSIMYLGRFFTMNVAIAADHRVIDSGPYRFIRHPSYTGILLAMLGLGLICQNWASLLIIFVPSCAVLLWRIHIEEKVLLEGLGAPYRSYMQRTKRLIPLIY